METTTAHKVRWFVYTGVDRERIPKTATMRGWWPGYDVECSCGWKSETGGAIRSYIQREVWAHKHGFGS